MNWILGLGVAVVIYPVLKDIIGRNLGLNRPALRTGN